MDIGVGIQLLARNLFVFITLNKYFHKYWSAVIILPLFPKFWPKGSTVEKPELLLERHLYTFPSEFNTYIGKTFDVVFAVKILSKVIISSYCLYLVFAVQFTLGITN